jgi:hypothetical protein
MVIADTKKIKIKGATSNITCKLATPKSKILLPLIIQRKSPVSNKKTPITM